MNFEKMVRYYSKVVSDSANKYGEDWRTVKYRGYLERIISLQNSLEYGEDDLLFLRCRETIAEVFGK